MPDFNRATVSITFLPTSMAQVYTSSVAITGGGLSQAVNISLTGFSVPPLTDTDGDNLLEINYIEQLSTVRNNLAGRYELLKNLDFTEASSYISGVVNTSYMPNNTDPTIATNSGFTPIEGTFTGTLEGNDFIISNLYINNAVNGINVGLFGTVGEGGYIQNLGLRDAYVKGTSRVGGLVGNNGGTISNCYATGTVTGSANAVALEGLPVGGLVGRNFGTIINCYALVEITWQAKHKKPARIGGLVGFNDNGSITNCYAAGTITGLVSTTGSKFIGGLVGNNSAGSTITNCYAKEVIEVASGGEFSIGGIVGVNGGNVTNCYATGKEIAEGANVVALVVFGIELIPVRVGGIVGRNQEGVRTKGTVTNCFWNSLTGQFLSDGSPLEAGLSTTDLQALNVATTATNPEDQWSTNDWDFGTDKQYPALRKYKTNSARPPVQVQGDIFCEQPAPRAEAACMAIAIATLGFEDIENPNTAIRLSPNPVTDRLYVQGNGTLQVQVRNILGTTLLVTEIIETGNITSLPCLLVCMSSVSNLLHARAPNAF